MMGKPRGTKPFCSHAKELISTQDSFPFQVYLNIKRKGIKRKAFEILLQFIISGPQLLYFLAYYRKGQSRLFFLAESTPVKVVFRLFV